MTEAAEELERVLREAIADAVWRSASAHGVTTFEGTTPMWRIAVYQHAEGYGGTAVGKHFGLVGLDAFEGLAAEAFKVAGDRCRQSAG